jgi:hypothetical protein
MDRSSVDRGLADELQIHLATIVLGSAHRTDDVER